MSVAKLPARWPGIYAAYGDRCPKFEKRVLGCRTRTVPIFIHHRQGSVALGKVRIKKWPTGFARGYETYLAGCINNMFWLPYFYL